MSASTTNPAQGHGQQSHVDIDSTSATSRSWDFDSSSSNSPTTPRSRPILRNRIPLESPATITSGSPRRRQSPLRQSVCYTDSSEHSDNPFGIPSCQPRFTKAHSRSRSEIHDIPVSNTRDPRRFSVSQDTNLSWNNRQNRSLGEGDNKRVSISSDGGRSNPVSPGGSSPFSFITSRMPSIKGFSASPVTVPQSDELINLDIEKALFANGSPADGQAFSPAAFMNLQMTAAGLLKKFQTAYQHQAVTLSEFRVEREAQNEENAGVETRTRHLKLQLEDMAHKASETEAVMQALMEELNREKRLRMEESTSREKLMSPSVDSISEDLGVEEMEKRGWRRSGETSKSEYSFETDEESIEGGSIFSRPRSPTLTAPSIMSDISHLDSPRPGQLSRQSTFSQSKPTRQNQPQMSAFQKIFKGISGDTKDASPVGTDTCRNCQGQDASMAWDTVSLLRAENKTLKERVSELEVAVEEVLDVVNGVGR